jgi:TusA-related sulfurtransferase
MAPEPLRVDTRGQTCPQPLTATTLALRRAGPGQRVEVVGDHPASFREIGFLAAARGLTIVQREGHERGWRFLLEAS